MDKNVEIVHREYYNNIAMFETTLKEFSKYPKDFEKLYKEKLAKKDTIVFDFKINNFPAFLHFNNDLFNLVFEVNNKNNELNNIYKSLPGIASSQYIRNSLVIDVKNTNEIEQVFSSRKEIFELAEDFKKRKSDKIGSIVSKYLMLLDNEKIKKDLSVEEIRRIYDQMFSCEFTLIEEKDKPDGVLFRKGPVGVYQEGVEEPVHSGIIPEEEIIRILNIGIDLLSNKNVNIFIRIAAFHYLFEYVHPFYDGNGRVGRYISSMLIKQNLSEIFAFRISAILKNNLSKYYKLFEDTEHIKNRGDITTFVYGFLELINEGYDDCIKYAKSKKQSLLDLLRSFEEKHKNLNSNVYKVIDVLYQASVFSDFGVTVKTIASTIDVSEKTVRRALEECKKHIELVENKHGKFTYYEIKLQ